MSQPTTDFHGILVNISVIRNEFQVFVDVSTQDRFPWPWILVSISVFRNEFKVFVEDVPSQDRFLWP